MITVIQFPAPEVWFILSYCWMWMSVEILVPKIPDVMGTYRRLSHTVPSCMVSCVRISEQYVWCWWLTGTDFQFLTTKDLWKYRYVVKRYFLYKTPKHDFLRFFWVAAHWFSNTAPKCQTRSNGHTDKETQRTCPFVFMSVRWSLTNVISLTNVMLQYWIIVYC